MVLSLANSELLPEEQFKSFLEAAPDAVVIIDQDGQIVCVNRQTENLFGYARDELLGRDVEILIPDRYRARHRSQRDDFVAHPTTRPMGQSVELWGLRKDGSEVSVEISLSPISNRDGILVVSIIRDVTGRRQMEQELREADRKKDEFLATLGHELRNPLAPIRNALQYLGTVGLKEADARTAREMIARQVTVMVRLVDDLLDLSRIGRNKIDIRKQRVELAAVLRSALEASRPLIQEGGHELSVSLPPQTVYLDADPIRLGQVFVNLLNNAAKYTKPGGHIWLTAERQGSDAVISVRDNGIGIPSDMLFRIFEMFTQVDRSKAASQGGLGIGLTLVRQLVEMHDGSIEACSNAPSSRQRVCRPSAGYCPANTRTAVEEQASTKSTKPERISDSGGGRLQGLRGYHGSLVTAQGERHSHRQRWPGSRRSRGNVPPGVGAAGHRASEIEWLRSRWADSPAVVGPGHDSHRLDRLGGQPPRPGGGVQFPHR